MPTCTFMKGTCESGIHVHGHRGPIALVLYTYAVKTRLTPAATTEVAWCRHSEIMYLELFARVFAVPADARTLVKLKEHLR